METLLKNDYTAHYGLPVSEIHSISNQTDAPYFEIEDVNRETEVYTFANNGTAVYNNPNRRLFCIINYDKFVTSLDKNFQRGKKRCDLIVHAQNEPTYFLLNELKDANPTKGRKKATTQLEESLKDIMAVPTIKKFVNNYNIRQCCFFNKRVIAPAMISATNAFNRINTITQTGLQLSNQRIENKGFTLFEYSGGKKYVII